VGGVGHILSDVLAHGAKGPAEVSKVFAKTGSIDFVGHGTPGIVARREQKCWCGKE
jgi:hypothetical protein